MNELISIEKKIMVIREQQVMLDRDLASLYEVETKRLNEAVKRNIDRFPEQFMFQLTIEEAEVIIDNFQRMINELPYDEEVLGELNIYNEVYKQPSRKKCALLPMDAIKKIIDKE